MSRLLGPALAAALALVGLGGAPAASETAIGRFPNVDPGSRAVVWAVGDGANGGATSRRLAEQLARAPFDRFLYLGDVYEYGTRRDFYERYAPVYGRFDAIAAPTPGNHEWPRRSEGYYVYWARIAGGRPPSHYTFRLAGWQVLSLNSEEPHDARSAQLRWLRRVLMGGGTCRVAFWHRPRFSAGKHGDQEDVAPLWDALRGRARIVINGHDHNLQRMRPVDGITEFVAGAGGRSHYDVREDDPRLAFADDEEYGALRLDLRPGLARYAFVALGGRVLDSGTITCRL